MPIPWKEAKNEPFQALVLTFQAIEINYLSRRTTASCQWEGLRWMSITRKGEEWEAVEDNIAVKNTAEIEVGSYS